MTCRRRLLVFAKPPLMGRAKTRLAAELGPVHATAFYRQATGRLLHRLGRDPRWETLLCMNAVPGMTFECWPGDVRRLPQGQGDLGARMSRAFAALPPGPALVIGTDSPQVEPSDIAAGFAALGAKDAVFGPAEDGGYWLIGLARRRSAPRLFEGVRWSTRHALADTEASLPKAFETARLRTLRDVDSAADLAALRSRQGTLRRGPWPAPAV